MPHPADKPIGWEWAERYPNEFKDPPLGYHPSPCGACGHPTGNCTTEHHEALMGKPPVHSDVVLKEDVYEDVPVPGSSDTQRRLKYAKGTRLPKEEAERLKVVAIQQQDVVPGEVK